MTTRKNPYTALLSRVQQYAFDVAYRHRKAMWSYDGLENEPLKAWRLGDLYQRVAAADELGYDVELKAEGGNLRVEYVRRVVVPYEFKPD